MAKKSAIEKNNKRKRLVKQFAAKRAALLAIANDRDLPIEQRFQARLKLAELPRNSAKVRVRNRCGITGRPRGYHRKFNMSRVSLRDLASDGQLPGVVKASW
jgi:small subunit ribosomal protein S14